jgi:hypothetical protein
LADESREVTQKLVLVEMLNRVRIDHELTLTWGF